MPPELPLEIQQTILALATRDRHTAAENLRVSTRTYPWMERLMYKKIVLDDEHTVKKFLDCLRLRPMHVQFAQQHIRSLFLVGSIQKSTLIKLLSLCNRVTCLGLALSTTEFATDGSPLWLALDALPLKSLVLDMEIDSTSSTSTINVFKNLTHLDICNDRMLDKPNAGLEALSALTHLCTVLILGKSDPVAVIRLIGNARLQILAFRVRDPHNRVERFMRKHEILDRRIVLLPIDLTYWAQLGQGDMLVWELAEEQVKLSIPENKRHRCLSRTSIENAYAKYDDDDGDQNPEYDCTVTMARTKGPHNDMHLR
ncbi:hypothetical protein DFJ58DRAFT_736953 [Suillus subalutaceus]|uniref:uncharacterized protein n=1 Tax=Suillus subalutaceus TaxID=48586 RepID=UPI001B871A53|nr:uncharacterized protein DFJ58DRAFT_736953 [Suillus subalutaceus]KAG1830496.1 hypothetical protein DFJ58DRAFT_736953 [Suillus subalutaceus]